MPNKLCSVSQKERFPPRVGPRAPWEGPVLRGLIEKWVLRTEDPRAPGHPKVGLFRRVPLGAPGPLKVAATGALLRSMQKPTFGLYAKLAVSYARATVSSSANRGKLSVSHGKSGPSLRFTWFPEAIFEVPNQCWRPCQKEHFPPGVGPRAPQEGPVLEGSIEKWVFTWTSGRGPRPPKSEAGGPGQGPMQKPTFGFYAKSRVGHVQVTLESR